MSALRATATFGDKVVIGNGDGGDANYADDDAHGILPRISVTIAALKVNTLFEHVCCHWSL